MFENEMKVTLPGISVQRKDGTIAHYRNSEYIPFFFMIPKEVVEYFYKPFVDIPREPYALFNDKDIKAKIESDLFLDFISIVTEYIPENENSYTVKCKIVENNRTIFEIRTFAGSNEHAKFIADNWKENASVIYPKILELITGKVDNM